MTGAELLNRRLANQHLIGPLARGAEAVVRRLGAVQAQDYGGARWALALRCQGLTASDVDRLLDAGRLLRTHVLRPTWHLVLPADIRWMLRLTAPRIIASAAGHWRQLGLDPATIRRSQSALVKALRGGGRLTREEISQALAGAGVRATGVRLGALLMQAEVDEVVVSGGQRGKQFTYALLDERAPPLTDFDRDRALVELTLRYLGAHGPAQDRDLAWWAALTLTEARRALGLAGKRLTSAVIDGKTFWSVRGRPPPAFRPPLAHLLPNFDEYDVAYQDHRPNQHPVLNSRPRAVGALVRHIVVMDGVAIGGWRRTLERRRDSNPDEPGPQVDPGGAGGAAGGGRGLCPAPGGSAGRARRRSRRLMLQPARERRGSEFGQRTVRSEPPFPPGRAIARRPRPRRVGKHPPYRGRRAFRAS